MKRMLPSVAMIGYRRKVKFSAEFAEAQDQPIVLIVLLSPTKRFLPLDFASKTGQISFLCPYLVHISGILCMEQILERLKFDLTKE